MNVEDVPAIVAQLWLRPARWAPDESLLGDFDGSARTLQVFNVELEEQFKLLEQLERHRPWLERAAGGPILVMFFTTKQSLRHSSFVSSFKLEPPIRRVQQHLSVPVAADCIDTHIDTGPHRRVA